MKTETCKYQIKIVVDGWDCGTFALPAMSEDGAQIDWGRTRHKPLTAEQMQIVDGICEEQCEDGDWADDDGICRGATVDVQWGIYCDDDAVCDGSCTIEIEPDEDAILAAAIARCPDLDAEDRSCGNCDADHSWTCPDGKNGACTASRGTSLSFLWTCETCGLEKRKTSIGAQRNPGDHDTVSYTMPSRDD